MDKLTKILTRATAKQWPVESEKLLRQAWQSSDKDLKITVEVYKANRSAEQNKLQRKWMGELESQGDMTAEEYRGYCKLHFGVAIAKENEEFAEKYDRLLKPFTYAEKLELMMVPVDMPVTRIFNTEQNHRYLNQMFTYWTGKGKALTVPADPYFESIMKRVG